MRIGLIGGGGISATHARAARGIEDVEIVAVHGANRDKVAALAREHGSAPCDTLDAFFSIPMDVVAIGSPSGLHAEQATAAARESGCFERSVPWPEGADRRAPLPCPH